MPCRLDFAAMRFRYLGVVLSLAAAGMWWSVGSTGVESNLRGVSVIVDATFTEKTTIWVSGSKGTILRSLDSGKHWGRVSRPAGDSLAFRRVVGIDRNSAYLMSSGEAVKPRGYSTRHVVKT